MGRRNSEIFNLFPSINNVNYSNITFIAKYSRFDDQFTSPKSAKGPLVFHIKCIDMSFLHSHLFFKCSHGAELTHEK